MARPLGWYSGTTLASRQGTAVATASLSLMAVGLDEVEGVEGAHPQG